ncbi:hypothetical protein [Serinicoccus profundi]|uniref:hypothetical protein n=1 Tax=Serinicoccus profundi TaxID=1078471 RepID=UPI0002FE7E71
MRRGELIEGGSPAHAFMHGASQDALRVVAELNGSYHPPEQVRALLAELTGREVPESVTVFPPFYSEFGKGLVLGEGVFINMGAASRTPAASPSATARSSATGRRSPPSTTAPTRSGGAT